MKKYLILAIVFLLFVAGSGYYLSIYNKPSQQVLSAEKKREAIANILDREPIIEEKEVSGWKSYEGTYINFVYPADATIHTNTKSETIVESFQGSLLSPRITISIQVIQSGVQTLEEYPAVNIRLTQKGVYQQQNTVIAGVTGIVFTKEGVEGAEKSVFTKNRDTLYSITISGSHMDKVEKYYKEIISSVAFK